MVHINWLTPKENSSPGLLFSIEAIAQLSVAVTVPVVKSVVVQLPVSVPMVIFDGNITVGRITSLGLTTTFFVNPYTEPSTKVEEIVTV